MKAVLKWKRSEQDSPSFLGLFSVEFSPDHSKVVLLYLRTWLLIFLIVGIGGYFTAVSSLYWWLGQRNNKHITYWDVMTLPLKYDEVRSKYGHNLIDQAFELFENQESRDGFFKLRSGLAKMPENRDGRIALAQIWMNIGNFNNAVLLLEAGLKYDNLNPEYLNLLFNVARVTQDYEAMINAGETALESDRYRNSPLEERFFIYQNISFAMTETGQFDKARELVERVNQEDIPQYRLIDIEIICLEQESNLSVVQDKLEEYAQNYAGNPIVLSLQVENFSKQEKWDDASRVFTRLVNLERGNVENFLAGFRKLLPYSPPDNILRPLLRSFYARFSWENAALEKLASVAAEFRRPEIVGRALRIMESRFEDTPQIHLTYCQSLLWANQWEALQEHLPVIEAREEDLSNLEKNLLEIFNLLVVIKNEPRDGLKSLLSDTLTGFNPTVKFYLELNKLFLSNELHAFNLEAMTQAKAKFPNSPGIAKALEEAREAAPEDQTFEIEPLRSVTVAWEPEQALSLIDEAIANGDWEEADRIVRLASRENAPWIEKIPDAFGIRRIEIFLQTRDRFFAVTAARLFMENNAQRQEKVYALAQQLVTQGEQDEGFSLLRELWSMNAGMHQSIQSFLGQEAPSLLDELLRSEAAAEQQQSDLGITPAMRQSHAETVKAFKAWEAEENWTRIRTVSRELVRLNPAWLNNQTRETLDWYLFLSIAVQEDPLSTLNALNLYLSNDVDRARKVLETAKEERFSRVRQTLEEAIYRNFPELSEP